LNEVVLEVAAADGYPLRHRSWQAGQSDTLIVALHGLLTHSGWLAPLGDELSARGIHVIGFDRRGSGLNQRERGDADGPQRFLDDLDAVVRPQRDRYRSLVYLGWCLGATVAIRYLSREPAMGDGLILMSPDVYERHRTAALGKVAASPHWDGRVTPRLRVPIRDEAYTDTPFLDSFVRRDPLKLEDFTPRFARASFALHDGIESCFESFRKPSLLVLAGSDGIIDNQRTARLYERIGSTRSETVVLDCHHGIVFEALDDLVAAVVRFASEVAARRAA